MLYAAGYRPETTLAHYRTLMAIEFTIGVHRQDDAIYLDACRAKRNAVNMTISEGRPGVKQKNSWLCPRTSQ